MLQPRALIALDDGDPLNATIPHLGTLRWASTARDPGSEGFFRVINTQGFQPGKPLLIGGPTGNIFPTPDLISFFLQSAEQIFQVSAGAQMDPTLEELGDIRTAVSEAVTNCIVHAYPQKIGIITLRCRILKDNVLDIVIKDKGIGIPDVEKARRPSFTTGGAERSGMGFTIMESFMTTLDITSAENKGTVVHMRRKLQRRQ